MATSKKTVTISEELYNNMMVGQISRSIALIKTEISIVEKALEYEKNTPERTDFLNSQLRRQHEVLLTLTTCLSVFK